MRYFSDLSQSFDFAKLLADTEDRDGGQRRSAYLVQVGEQVKVLSRRPQKHIPVMMTIRPSNNGYRRRAGQ